MGKKLSERNANIGSENKITELEEEIKKLNQEIFILREKLFIQRNELHAMRNSRVLGKIIKAREVIGDSVLPGFKRATKSILKLPVYYLKEGIIKILPKATTRVLVRQKRLLKEIVKKRLSRNKSPIISYIDIIKWNKNIPLVAVIIPYYNRASTIDETLQSLLLQTYTNFEVIVVDDGSTDPLSQRIFKDLPRQYKQLSINTIHQVNGGVASARNNGIKHTKAKYIICLDSDDMLTSTYIEKCLIVLEANPGIAVATTDREHFGVINQPFALGDYNPSKLYHDNMVSTAAAFTRTAWSRSGGYKSGIGYEDWDYWLTLAENGDWGMSIHEPLFRYRVAMESRFIQDKDMHWKTMKAIKSLHPNYLRNISRIKYKKDTIKVLANPQTAFVNLRKKGDYRPAKVGKDKVLIAIPWMTFGGAETLIYNYCREIKNAYDISFVTGVPSKNEWEYKFREITENIYHLPAMLCNEELYIEFISNYISTRSIDILHIVHSGFLFDMLPELKKRHPTLRVVVTMFNDRVKEYVDRSIEQRHHINQFNADSNVVASSFAEKFKNEVPVRVIPNGINCSKEFNPDRFDRKKIRDSLGLGKDDIAVFFVGRMSEEKNPDVFIQIASKIEKESPRSKMQFIMIGDGPMAPELKKKINEMKVKNLQFLGYKENVAEYLSAADVFILPSKVEGFPLSILEAMAMETAIIASRVGAVPDVIKDGVNGYIITPGSIDDGVKALHFLTDPEVLNTIKTNNRRAVEEKYSNRQLGLNYRRIYKDVLQK